MNIPSPIQLQQPQIVKRDYEQDFSKMGGMFTDLTTALAKLPQDINAANQLQDAMKNKKEFKQNLVNSVLSEMGGDWSEGDRNRFVTEVKSTDDTGALAEQYAVLMANRSFQKENKLNIAPIWRQRDYISFTEPMRKKQKETEEAELTGKQITAMQRAQGSKAEVGITAIQAGEGKPLTAGAEQVFKEIPGESALDRKLKWLTELEFKTNDAKEKNRIAEERNRLIAEDIQIKRDQQQEKKPANVTAFIDKAIKNSLAKASKLKPGQLSIDEKAQENFAYSIAEADIWQEVYSSPDVTDEKTAKSLYKSLSEDPANGIHARAKKYMDESQLKGQDEKSSWWSNLLGKFKPKTAAPAAPISATPATAGPAGW